MSRALIGNVSMAISKICSGLNQNALRYLQPHWMDAISGVLLRLGFAAAIFWIISLFTRQKVKPTPSQIMAMMGIGFVFVYGYMLGLLLSLTYSTPVSSSIILCTEPVWVLLMGALFYHTQITKAKIFGILLGFAGCLICILTQKSSELATNPLLGNLCCLGSTFLYSAYLVVSKRLLKTIDTITFNKWTFLGGAIAATGVILFRGFHAPVLECPLFSPPMLALLFVLIFSSTISYFLVAIGLKCLPATVVALYGYVILIVAMLASYALKQDTLEWVQLLAGCMIIASIYFVEIMDARKKD